MNEDDLLNDRYRPPGRVAEPHTSFTVVDSTGYVPYDVSRACQMNTGRWFCIQHKHSPNYQADAEDHNSPSCLWVWVCRKHSVETTKRKGK